MTSIGAWFGRLVKVSGKGVLTGRLISGSGETHRRAAVPQERDNSSSMIKFTHRQAPDVSRLNFLKDCSGLVSTNGCERMKT
jgi:hypothetical protein